MRALMLLLMLSLSALGLRADESSEGSDTESAAGDVVEAAPSEPRPPPAPVEVSTPADDSFLPTDQLRYDQEVDYPTDI